jgi:hypothetical protein
MSATIAKPPPLREYVCPVCLPRMRRVLVRAASGAIVEAYCRHCHYRKVIVIE